jgi:hypothetical protein
MKKKFLLLALSITTSCALFSQTYKYNFNNDLTEAGGLGPTLTEVLDLACVPAPTAGSFTNQVITTASGTCGSATPKPAFNFNAGGGLSFPNTSFITTGTYTIHILFKFNSIPGGLPIIPGGPPNGFQRIIEFNNGVNDCGLYADNACIGNCDGFTFTGVCPILTSNVYTLCSIVRDGGTNLVSIYFDGALFATRIDTRPEFAPATATTPIIFFRDNIGGGGTCEAGDGSIKYLSITAATSTAVQVSNEWTALCSSTLPLRLIDFSANKQADNSVQLNWVTDNEENTSHFELERSATGNNFSKIANVVTNNIAARSNYNFADRQPLSGTNMYRLKIYDKDGQYKYSNILKVTLSGKQPFEVFPSPAKDVITITGIKSNETVKLLNTEGKVLLQKTSAGQSITMDVSRYPTGVYIVTCFDGVQMQRQKIVKQ